MKSTTGATRRRFLQRAARAALVMPFLQYSSAEARLPIGFSTLGCPAWDWARILDFAQHHGFSSVELRGLQGEMDLPSRPEFAADRIQQSKKEIAAHGLQISCVSSSAEMHHSDPAKHAQQLADARRFIDLAAALDAPYVRVFGNEMEGPREAVMERVASSLRQLGDYAGPKNVTVIIESHGDFTDSPTLKTVLEKSDSPYVALLWDAFHTYISGKEDPEFTIAQLGKYIRHTHLKDGVKQGNDMHYVLTGRGIVPVKKQVQLLAKSGYQGAFSFEWEKVWHPDIDEPEIAIADYARVVTGYLQDAADAKPQ
ncbi:MAG TPA: sugar phosphate isomerase/epimerase family protein [Terriglobales bacterium]